MNMTNDPNAPVSNSANNSQNKVTMNGDTFADADTMVNNFLNDSTTSNSYTSFWFSINYVNNVLRIMNNEDLDGFRIYFAKQGGAHTIVMAATMQTQTPHPQYDGVNVRSRFTHKDVFTFNSNYFETASAEVKGSIESRASGALLFSPPNAACTNVITSSIANAVSCIVANEWVQRVHTADPIITTTSVWYPKRFFEYWAAELAAAVAQGKNGDGIRIYMAKKRDGKSTFVMTTTRIVDGNPRTDYFESYAPKAKAIGDPLDNGEECPISCNDVTWPE